MGKRIFGLIINSLLTIVLSAQCDCVSVFDELVTTTEQNYAGYTDKVSPRTIGPYTKHKRLLNIKSKSIDNDVDCYLVLLDYLAFFEDQHLQVDFLASPNIPARDVDILTYFSDVPKIEITESDVRKELSKRPVSPIEGIYRLEDQYKVAILKRPSERRTYAGIVLEADGVYWTPGQLKMEITEADGRGEYRVLFYMRDHSLRVHQGRLSPKGDLSIVGLSDWKRDFPLESSALTARSVGTVKEYFSKPYDISFPDRQTTMLRIASFDENAGKEIKQLLADQWEQILSRPNLLIDLRGNTGGTDYSYESILPLIYTDTIYTVGMAILASPTNIAAWADLLSLPNIPEKLKSDIRLQIEEMYLHEGSFVDFPDDRTYFKQVLPNPNRVAILIDEHCASASEQFLLAARQSDKVSLFGQATAGALDYSNMRAAGLRCPRFEFYYATTRSRRIPEAAIDNIGIQPDHKLVPGTDWIAQVLAWLSQ